MKDEKQTPPPSDNMQIEETKNELIIKYKWNKTVGYIALAFGLVWTAITANFFLGDEISTDGDIPWFALVFITPFIGAGLFIFYVGLAYVLNTTMITINFDNVGVRHRPIPWKGNVDIYKYDLKQLYVKRQTHKGKHGERYSYSLNAIDRENNDRVLLQILQNAQEAKWIEQKMEKFLKIEDKRVSGEYEG
jgi:hypothetical protein